jgi:hypothetical protein
MQKSRRCACAAGTVKGWEEEWRAMRHIQKDGGSLHIQRRDNLRSQNYLKINLNVLQIKQILIIQMLCFRTLSNILFYFKTRRFGDWILFPSSGINLLSWAQSIGLVPISGHLHQRKVGYTNQAQHKPSARVKIKH